MLHGHYWDDIIIAFSTSLYLGEWSDVCLSWNTYWVSNSWSRRSVVFFTVTLTSCHKNPPVREVPSLRECLLIFPFTLNQHLAFGRDFTPLSEDLNLKCFYSLPVCSDVMKACCRLLKAERWSVPVGQVTNYSLPSLLPSFLQSSRSLGRFTSAYEHAQFNPHLFSGDAASRGTSGVVGSYSPYLQGASLKVPGLDGYQSGAVGTSSYGPPSTLQQALLSPTPLDYRPPQQHVTPTLQGLLSPRHSLTGHADPRLPPQDLAALLKRHSARLCPAPTTPPSGTSQEYGEMLLLRQLSQGESLDPLASQGASGGQHYHHLLQIRPPEVQPQQHPPQAPCPSLPHSESMEEDEVPAGYHHTHEGLLAKAGEGHELLGPPQGGTPPFSSPTQRHGFIRSPSATRGKACFPHSSARTLCTLSDIKIGISTFIYQIFPVRHWTCRV